MLQEIASAMPAAIRPATGTCGRAWVAEHGGGSPRPRYKLAMRKKVDRGDVAAELWPGVSITLLQELHLVTRDVRRW